MSPDEAFTKICRDGRVLRLVWIRSNRGDSYLSLSMRAFPLPEPRTFRGPGEEPIVAAAEWLESLEWVENA